MQKEYILSYYYRYLNYATDVSKALSIRFIISIAKYFYMTNECNDINIFVSY